MAPHGELCALPDCGLPASGSVLLTVDGYDTVLTLCHDHAGWLDRYADEDAAVRVLDRMPEEASGATGYIIPTT